MNSDYLIDTETREHRGYTLKLSWYADTYHGAPWEEEDDHGPVSDWESRDKAPGEWILSEDRGSKRIYDAREALAMAKRDGWGLSPEETAKLAATLGRTPTKGQIAARSVELDFRYLREWCNGGWQYVGYTLETTDPDGEEITLGADPLTDSLWGIDSHSMADFAEEAFAAAIEWIDREIVESADAACRDIATV